MFQKFHLFAIIFALFSAVSVFAQVEEGFEPATASNLSRVSLPAGALRMSPDKVPAEITGTLDKFVAAGEGKFRQGGSEVLVWTGTEYKAAGLEATVSRLMNSMKTAGWQYEVSGVENGVTVFTLFKDGAKRRALMGFYGESDGTLVLGWIEVLPNDGAPVVSSQNDEVSDIKVTNGAFRSLIGTWDNGSVSTVNRQNTITGMITPGRSSRFEYKFTADGRFQFTGILQMTNYSCTDLLYNEKAGKFSLNGSTLTLTPSKNYWKKTNSCAPSSNSEKNQPLTAETYQFSTKINEYNQELICLTSKDGESCYRKKQ
jgi:hypothetical protein